MKRQKPNYLENITWSELRKQSLQTLKVSSTSRLRQILIFQIAPLVQVAHFESPALWPLRVYFFGKKSASFPMRFLHVQYHILCCTSPSVNPAKSNSPSVTKTRVRVRPRVKVRVRVRIRVRVRVRVRVRIRVRMRLRVRVKVRSRLRPVAALERRHEEIQEGATKSKASSSTTSTTMQKMPYQTIG